MASVVIRGKKKQYRAMWRDATGKQWGRNTKLTDRKEALALAYVWESQANLSETKRTVHQAQRVMGEIHRRFTGKEVKRLKLEEYAKQWLATRLNEVSERTHENYDFVVTNFVDFLRDRGRLGSLDDVLKEDVVAWRDFRRSEVGPGTTNTCLRTLRILFRQAKRDSLIVDNPMEDVAPVKVAKKDRHKTSPFTLAELSLILEHCNDDDDTEWESIVIHGYYCGQRLKDIVLMQEKHVDVLRKQVRFDTSKTGDIVIIDMPDAYLNWYLQRTSSDDPEAYLHPKAVKRLARSKKGSVSALSEQFAIILWKAGLRKTQPRKRVKKEADKSSKSRQHHPHKFHSLRHTMVTDLAESGIDRSIVQDIVGHKSAAVNEIYTHIKAQTKRNALSKLHDITKRPDAKQLGFDKLGA